MSVTDLLEEALRLPPSSRASLVEKIVESIAADITPEIERAHLSTVAKRKKSAAAHPEEIIPGHQVLEEARRLLRRLKFGFHAHARSEYAKAIRHYLKIDPRVAEDFVTEIEHGVQAICRNPLTWRVVEDDVRRYLVHRFPYGIYYTVDDDFITIWAIFHLNRKPGLWNSRLRKR